MKRRHLLQASAAALTTSHLATPYLARAQSKPDKLVYVGDNGPWHFVLVEEVGPAFEKATGIKIDYTLLPTDPWQARLKTELGGGSKDIDIVQWGVDMAGWISPHMLDHEALAQEIVSRDPSWDWHDFLTGSKLAATYDGKVSGIPYRITTGIMHYQKALLEQAGITKLPETFAELEKAAIATNKPPERYGFGLSGRQGPAILSAFFPWLYSCGGGLLDFKTGEILINQPPAIEALTFWSNLVLKDKVVPPEVMTWDFDEIVAGGQADRYAMCETFAPYGTLINDPKLSKTGGKWTYATVPGQTSKEQSRTWVSGHCLGVTKYAQHRDWSLQFIQMACSKEFMHRSMLRGNAPPRGSVLRDPQIVEQIGWPPVAAAAIETGLATPPQPVFSTLLLSLRAGLSQCILGQKTPKQALDDVATDWQRGLRRAGYGKG